MARVFLFGSIVQTPALCLEVLGQDASGPQAAVAGRLVRGGSRWQGASLVEGDGSTEGRVLEVSADSAARLAFYMEVLGAQPQTVSVGDAPALAYGWPGAEAPWDAPAWTARWGDVMARVAHDVLLHQGRLSVAEMRGSLGMIVARAGAWCRAQAARAPAVVQHGFTAQDVVTDRFDRPYMNYFAVEEREVRFRRFNEEMSPPILRAAFMMGDAVTVLPYDPVRDRVLVVEQFRFAPFTRGDTMPWSIETIAGRIDPGEHPEDTARRETREEAGLEVSRLEFIAEYYPSPGAVSEYLYTYVGLVDLPDDAARVAGLEEEAEDIRGILLSFDQLMAMLSSGEMRAGPLVTSALWLQANRDRLRAGSE